MLYHFEFRGERSWEAFGSGEGGGPEAITQALTDLRALAGGRLPEGEYRCIAATSDAARWESVWLDGRGGVCLGAEPDDDESRSLQEIRPRGLVRIETIP